MGVVAAGHRSRFRRNTGRCRLTREGECRTALAAELRSRQDSRSAARADESKGTAALLAELAVW